jgi:hypothetical protein
MSPYTHFYLEPEGCLRSTQGVYQFVTFGVFQFQAPARNKPGKNAKTAFGFKSSRMRDRSSPAADVGFMILAAG